RGCGRGRRAAARGAARRADAPEGRPAARSERLPGAAGRAPSRARARRPGRRPTALSAAPLGRVGNYSAGVSAPVRIVLVEDNQVFREALELLLGMRSDIEVVASVGDGSLAVAATRE